MISLLERRRHAKVLYREKSVTVVGAINRVLYAHGEWMKSHKEQPDFVVGLEVAVRKIHNE